MRLPWLILSMSGVLASCKPAPAPASDGPTGHTGPCPAAGLAMARTIDASDEIPGETAVAGEGDFLLRNAQASFVITRPNAGSTYYHYGGIVADAVAMDGCDFAGEDKLDEVGLVLAEVDLGSVTDSNVRGFRADTVEVISDGFDGGPAIVRATGVDDTYWVVEYTLIQQAIDDGGRDLSGPYGIAWTVDYILEPDSPVLRMDVGIENVGEESVELVLASLLSFGGTMDLHGYATSSLNFAGEDLAFGMPWLVSTDGKDALAYAVEDGNLAYMGISGIEAAVDVTQATVDPINVGPGGKDGRSMFLSVGEAGGTSATAPLAAANPEPIPDQPYTLGAVEGQVLDDAGDPVADAHIRIEAQAPSADWGVLDLGTTDADGRFSLPIPVFEDPWQWRLVAEAAGRHDSPEVTVAAGDTGVSLVLSQAGALAHDIVDHLGEDSPARLHLQETTTGAVLDLWLAGSDTAPVPPGTYALTATRGYEYAPVTTELTVPAGGQAELELIMVQVVDTTGWVSVDTHVHSSDSPDSRTSPTDVLLHAAAHGLDIVVHTEHEHIVDRSTLPVSSGLSPWVSSIIGEEVTATVPEHLTMFPAVPEGPRGGIIEWYGHDLDEIFGMMRERSGGGVNLLNHPSYLGDIGWDRITASPTLDDPTLLGLAPDAAIWSWDLDGLEVMNGHSSPFDSGNGRWNNWQSMLNAGHPLIAVGCSDDHGGNEVGFPRTYVPASSDLGIEVADAEVVSAFQQGAALASTGAFARLSLDDGTGMGGLSTDTDGSVVLDIHIEAIPEIDVHTVSVYINCDEVLTLDAPSPGGVVKISEAVDLSIDGDSHITIAAFGDARYPAGLPQFTSTDTPRLLSNPIYIDADGDGAFSAPGGRECAVGR